MCSKRCRSCDAIMMDGQLKRLTRELWTTILISEYTLSHSKARKSHGLLLYGVLSEHSPKS